MGNTTRIDITSADELRIINFIVVICCTFDIFTVPFSIVPITTYKHSNYDTTEIAVRDYNLDYGTLIYNYQRLIYYY